MKLPFVWMVRRAPREMRAVLDRKRIYVLPTRQGLFFSLILFLMLTGSINYDLSLGFALTFLLASIFLTSSYRAFSNLSGIALSPMRIRPVFAGEEAHFRIFLDGGGHARSGIGILAEGNVLTLDFDRSGIAQFGMMTEKRGWLQPGRFTIHTLHPLGFFRAWSYVELAMPCLVYPKPIESALDSAGGEPQDSRRAGAGSEDFAGLRAYRPGDPASRIAWKRASMLGTLQTKVYEEPEGGGQLWIEWDKVAGGVEERLSRLTALVLAAKDARFGLRLPGKTIPLGEGEPHRLRTLEALALFEP